MATPGTPPPRTLPLTVFHLTDVHGRVAQSLDATRISGAPPELAPLPRSSMVPLETWPGLASVELELTRQVARVKPGHTLLLHGGDFVGLEMIHDRFGQGKLTRTAFETLCKTAGIDMAFSAVGNHELDCGIPAFSALNSMGTAKFVCGNLTIDGSNRTRPLVQFTLGGWKIAVAGLTTKQTQTEAPATDRPRIAVADPLAMGGALEELNRLRQNGDVDLAIALVHLFDEQDDALCQQWPHIDLLIGGHSHKRRRAPNGTRPYFAKAQCHAMFLGVVPFAANGGRLILQDDESFLVPLPKGDAIHTATHRKFSGNLATLEEDHPDLYRPIAELPAPISAREVRTDECHAGQIVAQVILEAGRREGPWVHGAFINAGNIRGDLVGVANKVRPADLLGVVPYQNVVHVVSGPPELLRKVLANSVVCNKLDPAGFLQTAGIRWRVNAAGRLEDVRVEVEGSAGPSWMPIDSLTEVRLATINWLVEGGHSYCGWTCAPVDTRKTIEEHWQEQLQPKPGEPLKVIRVPAESLFEIDTHFTCLAPEDIILAAEADFGGRLKWARDRLHMP